jgi:hypothetical protein
MPKVCGKTVHNLWLSPSKTCVRLYTYLLAKVRVLIASCEQAIVVPSFVRLGSTVLFTDKFIDIYLLNVEFYTVSTVPITSPTK